MKQNGIIERFDENWLYSDRPEALHIEVSPGRIHQGVFTLSDTINDALSLYQGFHIQIKELSPMHVWFPYSRYTRHGMRLHNVDKRSIEYEVEDIVPYVHPRSGATIQVCRLSGPTRPKEHDKLRIINAHDRVRYSAEYPDSIAQALFFNKDSNNIEETGVFNDTIVFSFEKLRAASIPRDDSAVNKSPSTVWGGTSARTLRTFPPFQDPANPQYFITHKGVPIEFLVSLDLFATGSTRMNDFVRWTMQFMARNEWVFLKNGLISLVFYDVIKYYPFRRTEGSVHRYSVRYLGYTHEVLTSTIDRKIGPTLATTSLNGNTGILRAQPTGEPIKITTYY